MNMLPQRIRAFIAIRIPEGIIAELTEVQRRLKREFPDVAWTRPEAIHLTLQFLGHVESTRVGGLVEALRTASEEAAPFPLRIESLGCFGNRVIWAGVAGDCAALKQLAQRVRHATGCFGSHEEDREFNAHVTLGRIRKPARGVNAALRKAGRLRLEPWTVREIELIRSELSPGGSRYTTLAAVPVEAAGGGRA